MPSLMCLRVCCLMSANQCKWVYWWPAVKTFLMKIIFEASIGYIIQHNKNRRDESYHVKNWRGGILCRLRKQKLKKKMRRILGKTKQSRAVMLHSSAWSDKYALSSSTLVAATADHHCKLLRLLPISITNKHNITEWVLELVTSNEVIVIKTLIVF